MGDPFVDGLPFLVLDTHTQKKRKHTKEKKKKTVIRLLFLVFPVRIPILCILYKS